MTDAAPSRVVAWGRAQAAWLVPVAVALVFVAAGIAITQILAEVSLERIGAALAATPWSAIALSLGFTALSFITLIGYDWSALRYVGARLPLGIVALASFCGYAIGNMVGFSLVTGGGVRYRIYSAAGVSAGAIGAVALFCAASYAVGLAAVSAVALLLDPTLLAAAVGIEARTGQWIGGVTLGVVTTLVIATWRNRPIRIGSRQIRLPGGKLVLGQLAISAVDLAFAAAAFYVLLPADVPVSFLEFLPVYGIALAATLISHVPGGVGVFETVFLVTLGPRVGVEPLVAALVVFRATFYLLPMIVAALLLAANELLRHGRASAEAGGRVLPAAAAVLALVGGIALLAVAAAPASTSRLQFLGAWVPLPFIELAHVAGALAGVALLAAARSLSQRSRRAWGWGLAALSVGAVASLVRGWEWELAGTLGLFALILAASAPQFDRLRHRMNPVLPWGWALGLAAALGGAVWLMLFLHEGGRLGAQYLSVFALDADAGRSTRAILVAVVAGVALVALSRSRVAPTRYTGAIAFEDPRAPALVRRADGVLVSDTKRTVLAYSVRERLALAPLPPQGHAEEAAELIWLWLDQMQVRGLKPAFGPVGFARRAELVDYGFEVLAVGAEVAMPTDRARGPADTSATPIDASPGEVRFALHWRGRSLGTAVVLRLGDRPEARLDRVIWSGPVEIAAVAAVLAALPAQLAGLGVRRLVLGLAPLPGQTSGVARSFWQPLATTLFPALEIDAAIQSLPGFLEGLDAVWTPQIVGLPGGVDAGLAARALALA